MELKVVEQPLAYGPMVVAIVLDVEMPRPLERRHRHRPRSRLAARLIELAAKQFG